MEITILGSGTCVPSLERSSCSVLVREKGVNILVDAGPGTLHQLLKAGKRVSDVDALLLTHFHLDHSAELAPFLFATKFPLFSRKKRLYLAGGTGIKQLYSTLNTAYNHTLDLPGDLLKIIELDLPGKQPMALNGFCLAYSRVDHAGESRAFRLTSPKGAVLVCSGDTDYSEDLIRLSKGADVLICEAAFPDAHKVAGHLTPSLAGKIATRAGVKKLVLTHFYPECETVDLRAQCRKTYSGPLVLARDLMKIQLGIL